MKAVPVIIGLVAAAVVGALAATVVLKGDGEGTGDPSRLRAQVEDLQAKVERNAQEITAQAEVIRKLRDAPPLADMAPAAPVSRGAEIDAPVAAAPAAERGIEEKVKKALEESRREEQEAIGKRFSAMAAQREKAMVQRMSEPLGLSQYQQDEMDKILTRRREAIGEFFRTMFSRGGETTEDLTKVREKMMEVRGESDEEIKALLTPEQYEGWQKEEQSNRRGNWMMGGGGGNRPGGR